MDSPYQPPAVPNQPPPGFMPPGQKPGAIQVFGILDLVFCAFSILGALLGLIGAMSSTFLVSASQKIDAPPGWIPLTTSVISGVVGVLLLLAGIQLLQSRKHAIRWSNRYAWFAIAGKLVSIVLNVLFYLPMAQKTMSSVDANMRQPIQVGMSIGVVLGGLATMIYPTLCLVLLNRPQVKDWLAAHGRES
ncbi:MAG: hypothetical protein JWO82_2424 [Akkermansiaceae bacterium]|nr:hypothetical protein [Akkermansiaceae bacterium]